MKLINDSTDFVLHDTVVTIGKFDGIHRGHQMLFEALDEYRKKGLTSVILTFDMKPSEVLRGIAEKPIYTREETDALLSQKGPDILIRYPFTKELAVMTPEQFVAEILVGKLGAKAVAVGDDFRFGCGRSGDAECLRRLGEKYGFETRIIDRLKIGGETVSSTAIRKLMEEGRTAEAENMLGRDYFE